MYGSNLNDEDTVETTFLICQASDTGPLTQVRTVIRSIHPMMSPYRMYPITPLAIHEFRLTLPTTEITDIRPPVVPNPEYIPTKEDRRPTISFF